MGYTDFTASDVPLLLESITTDYRGDQYHLLNKNCNHFSDTFVQVGFTLYFYVIDLFC